MIRPTPNSTKIRRMRCRLRERLEHFLRSKPRRVRLEREAAPQVRSLESRFVLDASAALLGWDAIDSSLNVETLELPVDDSTGTIQIFSDGNSGGTSHTFPTSHSPTTGSISPSISGVLAEKDSLGLRLAGGLDGSWVGHNQASTTGSEVMVSAPRAHADAHATRLGSDPSSIDFSFAASSSAGVISVTSGMGSDGIQQGTGHFGDGFAENAADVGSWDQIQQTDNLGNEILFIDSHVQDYEILIAGVRDDVEVKILQDDQDGLTQISTALEGRTDLDAIHLISHGSSGTLLLGSTELTSDNLTNYSDALSQIGTSLSESGDIFLYGCDVAAGETGSAFVSALATATDADVAASNDRTGSAELGGDWQFESIHGQVGNVTLIDDATLGGYAHVLTTPSVTVDIVDVLLSDSNLDSVVTFEFSESVNNFDETDLATVGGVISGFTIIDADSYQAVFTADDGIDMTGSVTVNASYTDLAGDPGLAGSDTVAIDTLNPTVAAAFVESSLSDSNPTSIVNFTFSETPVDFTLGDITAVNGSMSGLVMDTATTYHATFVADDNLDGTGAVSVEASRFTDVAGNDNAASAQDNVTIDTLNPTVTSVTAS